MQSIFAFLLFALVLLTSLLGCVIIIYIFSAAMHLFTFSCCNEAAAMLTAVALVVNLGGQRGKARWGVS